MKKILSLVVLMTLSLAAWAQVNFTVTQKRVSPTEIDIIFKGTIAQGWHVYSTTVGDGGPTRASFNVDKKDGVELVGKLKDGPGVKTEQDPIFEMPVSFFEHNCSFTQRVKLTKKDYNMKAYMEFGACNDENCLPPTPVDVTVKGSDGPDKTDEAATEESEDAEETAAQENADTTATAGDSLALAALANVDSTALDGWYAPVIDQMKSYGEENSASGKGLWYIFLMGIIGGFIALVTPCVWPIIPMTVSFFLKRADDKKKGIRDAILYGVSIVVIYVALGLIVTSIFGTNALNDLSTNAIFNIFLFLLLVVFAASFMGGFEITLPSSWSNKIDEKANSTTGMLSIFLMALTLTLVSFSCTGPIIGFLLVEVTTEGGSFMAPTVGMLGFAIALALPFTLFALFPTWLKKAKGSGGGWMNVVKVVLGFIELAFALKFLSVADLAYGWHLLDRETFLALWIAIFGLMAAYLFGWIKFPHDDPEEKNVGVTRFFIGLCSLAFSIYMIPGLWGAPCKAVSAFAPPITTQDFNLDPVHVEPKFRDYEAGMAFAKQQHKPVLLDFTGFGCVNCRKMELAVWHDAKVRDLLNKDYVLISLYVDDKTRLPEPIEVTVGGKQRTLRTVGDKWSYLQETKFGANTQPQYIPVDNEGNALNHSTSYDEDVDKYVKFLREGLERYKNK